MENSSFEIYENEKKCGGTQESGSCPLCGGRIKYGERRETCNGMMFLWNCPDCGATGEEHSLLVFDGHHNVKKGGAQK